VAALFVLFVVLNFRSALNISGFATAIPVVVRPRSCVREGVENSRFRYFLVGFFGFFDFFGFLGCAVCAVAESGLLPDPPHS
jgi:hypothetical protein